MPAIIIEGEIPAPEDLPKSVVAGNAVYTHYQIYNLLDSAITAQLLPVMKAKLNLNTATVYDREMRAQALCLEMSSKGFPVDQLALAELLFRLDKDAARAKEVFRRLVVDGLGLPECNPNSPAAVAALFYDQLGLPEITEFDRKTGTRRRTADIKALEKIRATYPFTVPLVNAILAFREAAKMASVFNRGLEPKTGNLRVNFSQSGTETGRFSSQKNPYGRGTNGQNLTDRVRQVITAPDGYAILNYDLKTAESLAVGYCSGCLPYIEACLSGDVHTSVARLVWRKELEWTGDLKLDKALAESPFYRMFSYRDMAKRGGHGCLTANHEVLTREGWIAIAEVSDTAQIAVAKDGAIFFETPTHWERKPYSGILYSWRGTSVDLEMTHDHRVIYKADQRFAWKERPAEAGPKGYIPLGEGFVGGNTDVPARLIAAFQSDGHQKSANVMEFNLRKERKIKRLIEICEQCGYTYYQTASGRICVEGQLPKKAGAYMLEWTAQSIVDFVEEYSYWDGTKSGTATTIYCSDRKQLEWLQTLGRLVGIGGNIQPRPTVSGYGSLIWRLQQNSRLYATASALKVSSRAAANEMVYCPTVSTGAFLVRRNGRICITGNTNYYGSDRTMAIHLKVETKVITEFQASYFAEFPEIAEWHRETIRRVMQDGVIVTRLGRERRFWGRPDDPATWREAIAYEPQSLIADAWTEGLVAVQAWLKKECPDARAYLSSDRFASSTDGLCPLVADLRAQVHDSGVFLVPIEAVEEMAPAISQRLLYPVSFGNLGDMVIPNEVMIGKRWNKRPKKPPARAIGFEMEGLRDWKPCMDLSWLK